MKKRVLSLLLSLCLITILIPELSIVSQASTDGRTQADAVAWINGMIGTAINADNTNGIQCVDLIKLYYEYLGQSLGSIGYAYKMKSVGLPSGWNRYYSDPHPGDIFVWDAYAFGAYSTGHVGLIVSVNDSGYSYVDYNGTGNNEGGTLRHKSGRNSFTCVIRPDFLIIPQYTLDVNGYLDSIENGGLENYGTFDVFINGSKVAEDVNDYYNTTLAAGTTFAITDIRPKEGKSFQGIHSGERSGTLNGNNFLRLSFKTVDAVSFIEKNLPVVSTFNKHTYYYFGTPKTWFEADYIARQLGGHLVTISSASENAFIFGIIENNAWIGATDKDNEGNWKWVTGESFSYTAWCPGQPDNNDGIEGAENYAHIWEGNNGKWNDTAGSMKYPFVVEFEDIFNNKSALTYKDHTYYYYSTPATWHEANLIARMLGGHLVTISNAAENEFVFGIIENNAWIGATDKDNEGNWKWVTGESFSYAAWCPGQPDNNNGIEGVENYAHIWEGNSGKWNDTAGSMKYPFVVEFDKDNIIFRFADVKEPSAFYYEPVYWAYEHEPQITNGTDATHFSPNKTCTRAQVVTFLWRANGQPEPTSANNPFTDVNPDAYYYKAVLWAVEKGITNGVSATAFGPDRGCTRAQVVTFQWRANGQPEPKTGTNPFTDVKSDAYYYKAVLWAVENGITKGTGADKFSPDNTCTRGQIVTFLYRDLA